MDKLSIEKLKISMIINSIIFILTIIASLIMITGFKFMTGTEPVLESTKFGVFRFFTVQSNIFMGVTSLIFLIEEIKVLKGISKSIPINKYVLKLASTSSVSLTFFIVFTYLGPISDGGIKTMLMNSNLFFHLFIPVLSIITFIFFEKTNDINIKKIIYGVLPTIIYGFYYLINILIHMENGKVSPVYDWYWFVQNGVWASLFVAPLILVISYILSLLLWKLNKKN